jgi:polyhydroxyalkanoate synthesis repressor PhaR
MPTTRRTAGSKPQADASSEATSGTRVLKKYPNRRLYDTRTSSYITLADVKQMVLDGEDFEVRDAKSAEDLTRSILLQIILEEESGGVPMFSAQTLAQIIRSYGHAMHGAMGSLLEQNMTAFAELQKQFVAQSAGLYDPKKLTPDLWTQFVQAQPAAMKTWMDAYADQGKSMVEKMQQAGHLFPGIPGFPPTQK